MAEEHPLRDACKVGLGIQTGTTAFDDVIDQKVLLVQGYMLGAGVSAATMEGSQAVGVLVLGVGDLWELKPGEVKLSGAFNMALTQLCAASSLLGLTTDPADGDEDVLVDESLLLTFDRRIASYSVRLVELDGTTETDLPFALAYDITRRVLTVTPSSALTEATHYALVVEAQAAAGPSLPRTVISFVTA